MRSQLWNAFFYFPKEWIEKMLITQTSKFEQSKHITIMREMPKRQILLKYVHILVRFFPLGVCKFNRCNVLDVCWKYELGNRNFRSDHGCKSLNTFAVNDTF